MLLRANALAKGLLGRARRDGRAAARVPRTAACSRVVPARGSVGASGRSRAARAPRAAARRRGQASVDGRAPARRGGARARVGLEPIRLRGEGGALARQRDAVHGGDGVARRSCARGGSRGPPTSRCALSLEALQGSRTSFLPADPRAAAAARAAGRRLRTSSGCSTARRSSSRTAGATRCRTRTRCAARRRCTAPAATCSTTSSDTVAVELNAATDNPLVLVEDERARLERELPRPAARVRARRAGDGRRRAREHLRAPRRAARQPVALRRAAAVPRRRDGGLNSGFMIPQYVAAVARLREQGALRIRRASTRSRRAPGQEDHVSMGNAAGLKALAGARERASARSRSSCSPARRRSSSSRRSSRARRATRARDAVRALSPRLVEDRPLARRHRGAWPTRSATGSLVAAVEAEVGELRERRRDDAARRGALRRSLARSALRAGRRCNARSWSTEAPLRMLLNNLDPEVAERPEDLVVYGGSGQAARNHAALKAIVRTLLAPRRRRDAARPERQAGRRLPDAREGAARPDRELAARAALGDLGRVPPARGRGSDDVRPDDRGQLDLHRHAGDPPGHVPDVRGRRRAALRRRRT